jgi:hypothetical protein
MQKLCPHSKVSSGSTFSQHGMPQQGLQDCSCITAQMHRLRCSAAQRVLLLERKALTSSGSALGGNMRLGVCAHAEVKRRGVWATA